MRGGAVALMMLAFATPAAATPGGKLAGSFTARWNTGNWSGEVSMALDPGDAARDAAVQKIRSGQHVRSGSPFNTEGAHVTALNSVQDAQFDCGDGDGSTSRRTTTWTGVTDADAPFFIDRPELNLLKGTGTLHALPVRDNFGDPLPETGRDFFPVPGKATVHRHFQPCPTQGDFPEDEDDTTDIFGTTTDVAVPFGVPIFMESFDLPLRRNGTTWSAKGNVHENVLGGLPLDFTYDVHLLGSMASWTGVCVVPDYRVLAKTRSARAAVALAKKAGWPKARYAGKKQLFGYPRGHYLIDPKFSSSGLAQCLVGKPKIYLVK